MNQTEQEKTNRTLVKTSIGALFISLLVVALVVMSGTSNGLNSEETDERLASKETYLLSDAFTDWDLVEAEWKTTYGRGLFTSADQAYDVFIVKTSEGGVFNVDVFDAAMDEQYTVKPHAMAHF